MNQLLTASDIAVVQLTIKATDLRVTDVILRKGGARRYAIRQLVRFGLGTKITVQFDTYDWEDFTSDHIIMVERKSQ